MKSDLRLRVLKLYLLIMGIGLFFWWPLSHWAYPDFYHKLLGFEPGSYPDSMVKVIGTAGIVPVILLLFSARNPIKNRDSVITLIIFCLLMACTYCYLILSNQFPVKEFVNVILCLISGIILIVIYPWKEKKQTT